MACVSLRNCLLYPRGSANENRVALRHEPSKIDLGTHWNKIETKKKEDLVYPGAGVQALLGSLLLYISVPTLHKFKDNHMVADYAGVNTYLPTTLQWFAEFSDIQNVVFTFWCILTLAYEKSRWSRLVSRQMTDFNYRPLA